MAAGKLSPRQKMINMMYLVLTALLALNVSKEVLNSFFEVNLGIVSTTTSLDEKSDDTYDVLKRYNDKTASAPYISLLKPLGPKANDLILYIQEMKYDLVSAADNGKVYLGNYVEFPETLIPKTEENAKEFNARFLKEDIEFKSLSSTEKNTKIGWLSAKDSRDASTELFGPFPVKTGGKVDIKGRGTILNEKIGQFGKYLREIMKTASKTCEGVNKNDTEFQSIYKDISATLKIGNEYGKKGTSWEYHNFHDMPAVAALTLLSKWQADIRKMESDVASFLVKKVGAENLSFSSAKGTVIPSSNTVLSGQPFKAEIFLSAFDNKQLPIIYIDKDYTFKIDKDKDTIFIPSSIAQKLSDEEIVNGKGQYEIKTSGTGPKSVKGFMKIVQGEKDKYWSFNKNYMVAGKSFSISPTEMMVLYRGGKTKNPISVSVAGYQAADIDISFPGGTKIKTGKGTWDLIVSESTSLKKLAKINVTVRAKGKRISIGSKEFRVKPLPPPTAFSRVKESPPRSGIASRAAVKTLTLSCERIDFLFPSKTRVVSFRCRIQAGATPWKKTIKGFRLSGEAKKMIGLLESGQSVSIDQIKWKDESGGGQETILKGVSFTYYIK